jgi:GNAT superfamily N-acetyltransferase
MATQRDASQIAEIHVQTWQVAYRGLVPDDYLDALSVDQRAEAWRQILADSDLPCTGAFVLECDAVVVGFVHVSPSRDDDAEAAIGEVTAIYVLADFWSRGVGRALMHCAVENLRDAGFTSATLWVLDANLRARRFYEAAGWASDGATQFSDRGTFSFSEVRYRRTI